MCCIYLRLKHAVLAIHLQYLGCVLVVPAACERERKRYSWLIPKYWKQKERNVLFNEVTHFVTLIWHGHMVKDHSDSEKRNPLLPHALLFTISSKGYFI